EGAARLADVFGARVVRVAVPPGVLHLKSLCSELSDDTVLAVEGAFAPETFGDARIVAVPASEAAGSNVVVHGKTALVAAGCPMARERIEAAGFRTIVVDTSELRKADGALTCLSILV